MWTQWSITRLVRWRVRDWASCFTACKIPLDDDCDDNDASPSQLPVRNMVFETNNKERKGKRISKKLLRSRNGYKKDRYGSIDFSSQQTRNNNVITAENSTTTNNYYDSSCCSHFADDEDYIVFCFREDGAFDVVNDGKSEASNHIDCTRRSSWPVNKKQINFGETAKRVNSNEDGYGNVCPMNEAEIIHNKEDEEEEGVYLDVESAASSNLMRHQTEMMMSVESSDSNRSDNSSGSFAFPVLGWEWMDSPAQMPKSEGIRLRKHKARSLSFQCCRF